MGFYHYIAYNIKYLERHRKTCQKSVKRSLKLELNSVKPASQAGFCKVCSIQTTKLKRHLELVHNYFPCEACQSEFGGPCVSCSRAVCDSCGCHNFCPSCTIIPDRCSVNPADKTHPGVIEVVTRTCSFCEEKVGPPCVGCNLHVCIKCSTLLGFCQSCTIKESDYEHLSKEKPEFLEERASLFGSVEKNLTDGEKEIFEKLVKMTEKLEIKILEALVRSEEDEEGIRKITGIMDLYSKLDIFPGSKETETMGLYKGKMQSCALPWLLKR